MPGKAAATSLIAANADSHVISRHLMPLEKPSAERPVECTGVLFFHNSMRPWLLIVNKDTTLIPSSLQ